jgi:hypothetical protein
MQFESAVARMSGLLSSLGWPREICWVLPQHVLKFPGKRTVIFLPKGDEAEAQSQLVFRENYGRVPAIAFHAAGHRENRTYVCETPINRLAAGEAMFVSDGLKISAESDPPLTNLTRSALWWGIQRRAYRSWRRRMKRALAAGS